MANGLADYLNDIRYVEVSNAGASTIPAFGLMRVTGASTTSGLVLTVDQPNADGQDVLINGPTPIIAGGRGVATYETPSQIYYDTGDGTPANGETWGAGSGTYKAKKDKAGFKILGGAASDLVVVARQDQTDSGGGGGGGAFAGGARFKLEFDDYTDIGDGLLTLSVATSTDTIHFDDLSLISGSPCHYLTIPTSGYYHVGAFVYWTGLRDYLESYPLDASPTYQAIAGVYLGITRTNSSGTFMDRIATTGGYMPWYPYLLGDGTGAEPGHFLCVNGISYLAAGQRVYYHSRWVDYILGPGAASINGSFAPDIDSSSAGFCYLLGS